jgi:hypothetical protein
MAMMTTCTAQSPLLLRQQQTDSSQLTDSSRLTAARHHRNFSTKPFITACRPGKCRLAQFACVWWS